MVSASAALVVNSSVGFSVLASVGREGPVVVSAPGVVASSVTFSEGVVASGLSVVLTASVAVVPSVWTAVVSPVTPVLRAGVVEPSVGSLVFGTVLTSGASVEATSVAVAVGAVVDSGVLPGSSVVFGVASLGSYVVVPSDAVEVDGTDGVLVAASSVPVTAAVVEASGDVVDATSCAVVLSALDVVSASAVGAVVTPSVLTAGVVLAGSDAVVPVASSSRAPSIVLGPSVVGSTLLGVTCSVVSSGLAVVWGVVSSVSGGFVVTCGVVLGAPVDASSTDGSVVSLAPSVGAVALVSSGAGVVGHS